MVTRKAIVQIVEVILESGAKQATKYFSDQLTLRGTFVGKRRKRDRQSVIVLSIGKPNYAERIFIKKCKLAGEPFPIKKLQIKFPVAKK